MSTFRDDLVRYGPGGDFSTASQAEALAYCEDLTRRHYENFTVASWLLPQRLRPHFASIYGFCRWSDDLADEIDDRSESLRLLSWWNQQLEACYQGTPRHPVMVALRQTIQEFDIPITPFQDLISAFRQDQIVTRYETFAQLEDYCRRSANPVGHLVLYLGRSVTPESQAYADQVCTGLQLINFWQDLRRDWEINRVYLPAEDFARFDLPADDLAMAARQPRFKELVKFQVDRAEEYLRRGAPIVGEVSDDLKVDVALFVEGGLATVQAVRRFGYDTWNRRPEVSRLTKLRLLTKAWYHARLRGSRRYQTDLCGPHQRLGKSLGPQHTEVDRKVPS
ncbi:MAG: squalene synthase HpnC [Pirellulaceae bacterium]